ncbi:hypothetical protein [Desulfovibrio inopinatus]|uniref:hypothetical protein n=1 Tax=Desulfovibrio inopinatus TaxID=102109 RepID=UPI00040E44A7|nr:hypothetical protein [Desulfovibrio inopinatus]
MSQRKKDDEMVELEQESVDIDERDDIDEMTTLFLGKSTSGPVGFDLDADMEARMTTCVSSTLQ